MSANRPINLAILIWSGIRFGGAERRFIRLAAYLAAHFPNVHVTLYCLSATLVPLNLLKINPSPMKVVQFDSWFDSGILAKVSKLWVVFKIIVSLRRNKHDHIFVASNPDLIPYLLTRFSKLLPRISVAMVDPFHAEYSTLLDRYLAKQTLRKVYSVDCLSEGVMTGFTNSINNQDIKKIHIAPCSFTDFSKVVTAATRDIDVTLIGRFVPAKGHELLEKISGTLHQYNVHVCGSGPLKLIIPCAKIYEAKYPFDILSRTKISLSLQLFDNYPSQVVLESMASGCAIIATDTGATRKFLDESCAILIPYDANALASAIQSLLFNPEKCYQLGQAARKKVLSEHTVERYADYFVNEVIA
jgi:glycosyltransferase involved in cell wall biosynthesis